MGRMVAGFEMAEEQCQWIVMEPGFQTGLESPMKRVEELVEELQCSLEEVGEHQFQLGMEDSAGVDSGVVEVQQCRLEMVGQEPQSRLLLHECRSKC